MGDYAGEKVWKQEKQRRILEAGFRLFAARGIELVTMPEVAKAGNVSRATLFRYFPSKLELVIAIGTWKWEEYIAQRNALLSPGELAQMTGAQRLRVFLDSFLALYRDHRDILRFNYNFNSFLQYEASTAEQKRPYLAMTDALGVAFHELYQRGMADGTLDPGIGEKAMFSSCFHIMLAAVTRYAVGLAVVYDDANGPENELVMLEELLLGRFTREKQDAI